MAAVAHEPRSMAGARISSKPGPILVVSDVVPDAKLVGEILEQEFDDVFLETDPADILDAIRDHRPRFIVYAFESLDKSIECNAALCADASLTWNGWRVAMCTAQDLKRAYELVESGTFDDYVVFWPLNHDPLRLRATVHLGARRHASARAAGNPLAVDVAEVTDGISSIGSDLEWGFQHGSHQLREFDRASAVLRESLLREFDDLRSSQASPLDTEALARLERLIVDGFSRQAAELEGMHAWLNSQRESLSPRFEAIRESGWRMTGGRRVLVVDDDKFCRKVLGQILSADGYDVVYAACGGDVDWQIRQHAPDLVFLDMRLGDVDGMQVLRQIRASHSGVPVVMVSGYSHRTTVVESLSEGAADFLAKPFSRNIVLNKLRRVLKRSGS